MSDNSDAWETWRACQLFIVPVAGLLLICTGAHSSFISLVDNSSVPTGIGQALLNIILFIVLGLLSLVSFVWCYIVDLVLNEPRGLMERPYSAFVEQYKFLGGILIAVFIPDALRFLRGMSEKILDGGSTIYAKFTDPTEKVTPEDSQRAELLKSIAEDRNRLEILQRKLEERKANKKKL